jgi:hypothetical protein
MARLRHCPGGGCVRCLEIRSGQGAIASGRETPRSATPRRKTR